MIAIDQEQKELVRASFAKFAVMPDMAASLYGRLFAVCPGVRPLFLGEIEQQGRMLMAVLASTVGSLDALDGLTPAIRNLGRRHMGYGVEPGDYDQLGAALLWTLEQALGEDFTPATHAAWAKLYQWLADEMQKAARPC